MNRYHSNLQGNGNYTAAVIRYDNYNMAVFAKDSLKFLAKPLGTTAVIPALATIGSISASLFSVTVTPFAGAVILGNFGAVAVYTAIALQLLFPQADMFNEYPAMTLKTSLINALFFTHVASTASFSYFRIAPVGFHDAAVITGGAILVALACLYIVAIAYQYVPFPNAPDANDQSHLN